MKKLQSFRMDYFLFLAIIFFVLLCPVYGQSNSQSDDGQILQSLLKEVRLLRQSLQNTNLYAYRSQVIVERVRAQRDRVDKLTVLLENTRNEIKELELQSPQLQERLREVNERIEKESDLRQRKDLENEAKDVKQILSQQEQRGQEIRNREYQLNAALREEQAKLEDLDKRLETLERELEQLTESNKPKEGGKKDK